MLFLSLMVFSVVYIECVLSRLSASAGCADAPLPRRWFLWGYSLAFGEGSKFIGDLKNGGLVNVDIQPSGSLPVLLFALYQVRARLSFTDSP